MPQQDSVEDSLGWERPTGPVELVFSQQGCCPWFGKISIFVHPNTVQWQTSPHNTVTQTDSKVKMIRQEIPEP